MMRPIIPVKNTIMTHSAPLDPLLFASLYTHTMIRMSITRIITAGNKQAPATSVPIKPPISGSKGSAIAVPDSIVIINMTTDA